MSTKRVQIGESLFKAIETLLNDGQHISLLGSRDGGKTLVLAELTRRAYEQRNSDQPRVVRLKWDASTGNDEARFRNSVAEALHVSPLEKNAFNRLAMALESIFKRSAGNSSQRLWIFVQDILSFPNFIAREMLFAFQVCSQADELRQKFGVIVTGGGDFRHLTFGENSPYRYARPFLITGLDEPMALSFFCRRRQRQFGKPGSDYGLTPVPQETANLEIGRDAFDLLYTATGGQAHLLQEIVVSSARYPFALTTHEYSARWDLDHCKRCIDNFVQSHMENDYVTRLTMRDIERDPEAFDLLLKVLESGEGRVTLPGDPPASPEMHGVIRRDATGMAVISCEIWRAFLGKINSSLHRADVFAMQGQWRSAWHEYRESPAPRFARPISGSDAYRLDAVLSMWAGSLLDRISDGPRSVCSQFSDGVSSLLGFNGGGLFDTISGSPIHGHEDLNLQHRQNSAQVYEKTDNYDLIHKDAIACYFLNPMRSVLRSSPVFSLPWPAEKVPVLYLERRGAGQEIDSAEQKRIPRLIGRFWHAYHTACRIQEEAVARERLRSVTQRLNTLLVNDPFDMGEIVQSTADLLVQLGGYLRIQIALVDAKEERIQTAASASKTGEVDVDFNTNLPLKTTTNSFLDSQTPPPISPHWDIQQKVCLEGNACSVFNASDPAQTDPTTQSRCGQATEMKGITVVPIRFGKKVIGTIHFEREDKTTPSPAETELFQELADHVGVVFYQAQRLTLLQKSLDMFRSKLVIINANHEVVFVNESACKDDYPNQLPGWLQNPVPYDARGIFGAKAPDNIDVAAKIWQRIEKMPPSPAGQPPQIGHYLIPGVEIEGVDYPGNSSCEWILAPIDDYSRIKKQRTFRPDPRIGYAERIYDITEFFQLLNAVKSWLELETPLSVAKSILDYAKKAFQQDSKSHWARIYVYIDGAHGQRQLRSFCEFGIEDEALAKSFIDGRVVLIKDDSADPLAWHAIMAKREGIYIYKPENPDGRLPLKPRIVRTESLEDVPTFHVNYRHPRDQAQLCKSDASWIEAPLIVGDRLVGKFCMSMLGEGFNLPHKWDLFRYAMLGAATALRSAFDAQEQMHLEAQKGWLEAAGMLTHRIGNILPAVQTRVNLIRTNSAASAAIIEDSNIAWSGVARSMAILQRIKQHLRHTTIFLRPVSITSMMVEVIAHCSSMYPETKITSNIDVPKDLMVKVDVMSIADVFLELVTNSISWHPSHQPIIHISCALAFRADNQKIASIHYRDNGPGVLQSLKETIFNSGYSSRQGGTGIGLYDARSVLRQHQGSIIEVGTEHEGAIFLIEIPIMQ